jgi:hypothetical protein
MYIRDLPQAELYNIYNRTKRLRPDEALELQIAASKEEARVSVLKPASSARTTRTSAALCWMSLPLLQTVRQIVIQDSGS